MTVAPPKLILPLIPPLLVEKVVLDVRGRLPLRLISPALPVLAERLILPIFVILRALIVKDPAVEVGLVEFVLALIRLLLLKLPF